ncbi:GNAT family N-acetyltransferase [Sutcliffiella horikoshii]|uniref:GNAT family N-acetyltransferase n=1 Tax=Sutcliffiella horikoshii TaxID=79883 RepID=A0A5D4T1R3_9BACI|nr:GNAT family N-acetyltransferase [Sutcliffiella horikoshii]TYS69617.1 GNAT family N-acetyltransferase [Sutcliffiella horikoshii]
MDYQQVLLIEKATPADGPAILELLKSRATDLKSKGSSQWSFLLTGDEDAEILQLVTKGLFYKVAHKSDIQDQTFPPLLATFMLSDKQEEWDVHLWGQEETQETVYLHKLAVAMQHRGEGLGDRLMDWIKEHGEELGYSKIRLDCVAGSEKLRDFYAKHGFTLLKIVDGHCLYEWETK